MFICFNAEGYAYVGVVGLFFFQAEDGIRYLVRSRGLGDVYKRQGRKMGHVTRVILPPAR